MTLANARSLLRVSAKALRVRSASTDGQMKSGYPIWKRGLHACKACGKRGADVRPDFHWNKPPVAALGYR
jgi:hypothetical protein